MPQGIARRIIMNLLGCLCGLSWHSLCHPVVVGLLISVVFGGIAMKWLFDWLSECVDRRYERSIDADFANQRGLINNIQKWVGSIERLIYFYAAYRSTYELVAALFTLKAILKFSDTYTHAAITQKFILLKRKAKMHDGTPAPELNQFQMAELVKCQLRQEAEYHQYIIFCSVSLILGVAGGLVARAMTHCP